MIKNANQMWAEFGDGDIIVGSMLCSDDNHVGVGVLTLANADKPHEIGTAVDHPEDVDPFDVPIVMAFKNIPSLDVVLEHLTHIREEMVKWENGEFINASAGDESGE